MQERTIEDYCRLISKLDEGEGVSNKMLSKELGLSKSTVSLILERLKSKGYIKKKKYGRVSLTKKGKLISKKMNFKHRVIETFLYKTLKLSKSKVHEIAHKIEHDIDDETVQRMYSFIGKPKYDCHGSPIE